jgi:DNA repair protein RadD
MTQTLFAPAQLATEKFAPRPYQSEAISSGVNFFNSNSHAHAIEILPTGSGKSVVIANTAKELEGKTIVFQPSKEILEQNYAKFTSYGYRASIYSASAGQKRIDKVTFATIGSVAKKHYLFRDFKNIIVDECHLVNPKAGMYHDFIKALEGCKVLGLTATPYRLTSTMEGAMLKFLTRTRPRIFSDVLYVVQNNTLFDNGFLAPLKYYAFDVIDRKMLSLNKSGTDFDERSLRNYYKKINFPQVTAYYANRILAKRDRLLIFSSLIEEAEAASRLIPGSVVITGKTDARLRERILADFKANRIKCLLNVGVLTTGFDYPELQSVLIARSTMSLSLYYQIIGRVMRPFTYEDGTKKEGWVVDIGNNINFFGKIETMKVVRNEKGLYSITNNGKHLTNVTFQK